MRRIVIHPDVSALLGEMGKGDPLKAVDIASVDCTVCGEREVLALDGPPLSMILEKTKKNGRQMVRLQFAHERCAPSAVAHGHPDEIEPALENLAVILMTRNGVATLAFAPRSPFVASQGHGDDWEDLWTAHFREAGFVATDASADLEPLQEWCVEVRATAITIVGPAPHVYEFAVGADPAWDEAIRERPLCLVITGLLDIADFDSKGFHQAVDDGRGVVALLKVVDRR